MKFITSLLIASAVFLLIGCKKQSNNGNSLPPVTKYGANTFGCLINGQLFLPNVEIGAFTPPLTALACMFSYDYYTPGISNPTGFEFVLQAQDEYNPCNGTTMTITFDSVIMQQGIYTLQALKAGQGEGRFVNGSCAGEQWFNTTDSVMGQLILTRFDSIASGTFWFNVLNQNNDTIKVTDGRFDVHMNQE